MVGKIRFISRADKMRKPLAQLSPEFSARPYFKCNTLSDKIPLKSALNTTWVNSQACKWCAGPTVNKSPLLCSRCKARVK